MLTILNTLGQVVGRKSITTAEGFNDLQVDVSNLPLGTYILNLETETANWSEKFNVMR